MERVPFSSVDELVAALASTEGQLGEDLVPDLDHLLQTAEALADAGGDDPELVVAGLVHDVASALDPHCGDHARHGADLVAPLLGPRVAALVAGHAEAKRYLVTVEPAYAQDLSPNSTATLVVQGGRMSEAEVARFRSQRHWEAMVALRRADDAAKVPGRTARPVTAWSATLQAVARASIPG